MATLADLFRSVVDARPNATALVSGDLTYSYMSLFQAVKALADQLQARGIQRLGLCGDNTPGWVIADLACLSANVVCVPVPPFFSAEQKAHLIRAAGLQALLWSNATVGQEALSDGVSLSRLDASTEVVDLPTGTAKITFTSGSTGLPRGVCLSRAHLAATACALKDRLRAHAGRSHLCILPLATLLENVAGLYLPLLLGSTVRVEPLAALGMSGSSGVDASRLAAAVNHWRPESLILVPELARLLVQQAERGALQTDRFRFLAVGGGKVASALLARAHALGLPLFEGYGLSECGSVVALNTPADNRPGTAGRSLDHVEVRVDEQRRILIRGNTFLGYLGAAVPQSSWLDTGDLGSLSDDGFLTVDGRSKNLLITSFGRNISPEWLESELIQTLGAQQALVFGDGEARPRALIYGLHTDSPEALQRLAAVCHQLNDRLPDYARLSHIYRLVAPLSAAGGHLTANGRLMRHRIHTDLPRLIANSDPMSLILPITPINPITPRGTTMAFFDRLQTETAQARTHVTGAPVVQAVQQGRMTLQGYTWFLTQAFHHVKHTVPLMMACGGRLPERLEGVRKALVEYIEEEYGHHEWILDDLQACGEDREERRASQPDLSIELMVAYLYHQIDRGNPAAFFGMVQVLEGTSIELATPLAQQIQQQLQLPDKAFSYLYSHGELDQGHFEFFRDLMNSITDPDDQQAIIDSARVVYRLYGDMLHRIPLPASEAAQQKETDHAAA
ncbi:AMP-binding protein [Marinobacter sp. M-5]|uniref:AMP-binding protein n=1 Tax=Marinobacter sp. M-5 TaxID=3081089 RepID=UPI00293CEB4B|nr:AMP-binding protein [Marinobacter sp. M-5]MDV3503171.1 AMP-binding protein [Marinobacter sp. M-5]